MDALSEAVQVLYQAEQELRDLLAKAASGGRYDEVSALSSLAKDVSRLATSIDAQKGGTGQGESSNGSVHPTNVRPEPPKTRSGLRESKKRKYPIFLRDGDVVVKLGWSKSEKAEYEHKAPKSVLVHLVSALNRTSTTKKRFAMDEILPLKDSTSGAEIPVYQAYLCLAWLREAGLVEQHGRQGYSVPKRNIADSRVEELWNQLPSR